MVQSTLFPDGYQKVLTFSDHSDVQALSSGYKPTQADPSRDHMVHEAWCASRPESCRSRSPNMRFIYPGRLPTVLFRDQTRRP